MKIALLQTDLHWENVGANLAMLEEKIWEIGAPVDVILLPEMFNTGFSMAAAKLAEPMNLTTFKWLRQQAAQTKALCIGSYIVAENGQYFNRLIAMKPNGQFQQYDKRHLFRMAKEDAHFSAGHNRIIVEWKGWKFCPLVCYDLRFPVWSRNQSLAYDCLLYVANWPQVRVNAWDVLLQARAMENLAYCIGVNRTGTDGHGIAFNGHSAAYDPRGNALAGPLNGQQTVMVTLDRTDLDSFRQKFPAHLDADSFSLNL